MKAQGQIIKTSEIEIKPSIVHAKDFINLNEMIKDFHEKLQILDSWINCKETIDFLETWESSNNPDTFNKKASNKLRPKETISPKNISIRDWVEKTNAIGLVIITDPQMEIYAHPDIAFEFGTWVSPKFKLYLITEFQRLKAIEKPTTGLGWQTKRELAKINYRIQANAIKQKLLDKKDPATHRFIYASEAELLNKIVFGETSKHWRKANPELVGNQRDYASATDEAILANLEATNAALIEQGLTQRQRYRLLLDAANSLRHPQPAIQAS